MSLNYTTGSPYYQPAIQTQGGTTGTTASLGISRIVQVGIGAPPFKQSLVPIATAALIRSLHRRVAASQELISILACLICPTDLSSGCQNRDRSVSIYQQMAQK